MKLRVLKISGPELTDLAAQLPAGRIYASGHGFVPPVRPNIYDRLSELADPKPAPGLPGSWDDIDVGHLVLAKETPGEGWWEAVVLAKDNDMLTIKWRDYPKYPPMTRHRASVALLKPTAAERLTSSIMARAAHRGPSTSPNDAVRRSAVDITRTERIRVLNDELRQYLLGGLAMITPGVAALGQEAVERIVKTIAVYDDFCHANDPHEEHDFGSFEAEGQTILFKIDYFDKKPDAPLTRSIRSFRDRTRDHHDARR